MRPERLGKGWGRVLRARERFAALPKWERVAILVVSSFAALLLVAVGTDAALSAGRVHPGVTVQGVDVGGLSPDDAGSRIQSELGRRLEETVTVVYEDHAWSLEASSVGAVVDASDAVRAAYQFGRRGDLWSRLKERAALWFSPQDVPAPASLDETMVAQFLDSVDEVVFVAPVDAEVSIEGTTPVLSPSSVGQSVDRERATQALSRAFVSGERTVDLPIRIVPAAVADEDAQDALEVCRKFLSGPVTLNYESRSWSIEPETIAGWVVFEKVPFAQSLEVTEALEGETTPSPSAESSAPQEPGRMVLVARLSAAEVSATVTPLVADVGKPAKDAEFHVSSGVVTIEPSEVGLGPDIPALVTELETALRKTGEERVAALRMRAVQPDLTTEEARAMGIQERIATFTTHFSSSNAPRVNNIQTLARALDGTLIPPGGVFSFNDVVGPRTAEKGYREAGTIVNGQIVPTLGGGICQVCTTLFNSVFLAGLPVEERSNHSFYISSYPTGRDATVSWGGPDFKFRNDTSAWILVATAYTSSSVTISLYGTDPGYTVEYETGPWTDIKPYTTKTIEDPELDEGIRVVEQGGVDGRTVVVTRRVYKDGRLVREDEFVSRYNPKQEIVRVGTRPVASSEEETATAQ